jgi:voltage-gated potassium channel
MDSTRHLVISVCLTLVFLAGGTIGYMAIEHWNALDGLYMTVITLTTVGYGEVHKLSHAGRIFTILLVTSGFGFVIYVASALVQFMVEGRIRAVLGRRRLDRKIGRLRDHYIVCGYGRIGRVLCRNLMKKPVDLVVIEQNLDTVPVMDADGVLYLAGDAADETMLIKAGIQYAKGLVAVLATDTDNVFLVLTARQLNPSLNIIARAGRSESKSKLRAAGADKVESPYEMGAASMAQRILRPTVTSFLELALAHRRTDIQMEEIPIARDCPLVNVMLKDSGIRQQFNLIIVAIKKSDERMHFNPSFETVLEVGDTLIAVGEGGNLQRLEKVLNPSGQPA